MALVISGIVRRFSSLILRRIYGSLSEKHLQTMRPSCFSSAWMSTPRLCKSTPRRWAQLKTAASSASAPMTEQWIFCRGKPSRNATMSLFVIFRAWTGVRLPCSISVHSASEAAMAEVQPNVR